MAFSVDHFLERYAEFQESHSTDYHVHPFEGHCEVLPSPGAEIDEHVAHLLCYDTNIGHYAHWLLTHQTKESDAASWSDFGLTRTIADDRVTRLRQMLPSHSDDMNAWREDWIRILLLFWEMVQDALGHLGDASYEDSFKQGWYHCHHYTDNTTSIPLDWTMAKLLASFARDSYRSSLGQYREDWFGEHDQSTHGQHMAEKYNIEFAHNSQDRSHGIICLGEYDDHSYGEGAVASLRGHGIYVVVLLRYHQVWHYGEADRSWSSHEETELFIVFRGTDNIGGWVTDLRSLPVHFPHGVEAHIHRGFKSVYQVAHQHILAALSDPAKRQGHPMPSKIYITGHSLGGALATVCAFHLRSIQETQKRENPAAAQDPEDWSHADVHLYTFGSPAVGNKGFIDAMKELVANKTGSGFQVHFRTKYDPIPDSPTFLHYESMDDSVRYFPPSPYRYLRGPEQAKHADVNLLWDFVDWFHKKRNHNLGLMDWVPTQHSLKPKAAEFIWLQVIKAVGIPLAIAAGVLGFAGTYIYIALYYGGVEGVKQVDKGMRRLKVKVERIAFAAINAHAIENYEEVLHNHVWYEHNADTIDQTGLYRSPLRGIAFAQEDADGDDSMTGIIDSDGNEVPAPTRTPLPPNYPAPGPPGKAPSPPTYPAPIALSQTPALSTHPTVFDLDKVPELPAVAELEQLAEAHVAEPHPGAVDSMHLEDLELDDDEQVD